MLIASSLDDSQLYPLDELLAVYCRLDIYLRNLTSNLRVRCIFTGDFACLDGSSDRPIQLSYLQNAERWTIHHDSKGLH